MLSRVPSPLPLTWTDTLRLGDEMPEQPILLKALLRERHWQNYATFCAEYDKVARRIDPNLVQTRIRE